MKSIIKSFFVTIASLLIGLLALLVLLYVTSMMFQLINFWIAVITLPIIGSFIYGLSDIYMVYIPYMYFKLKSNIPAYIVATIIAVWGIFSLINYKELNSFYFPNWVFICFNIIAVFAALAPLKKISFYLKSTRKSDEHLRTQYPNVEI